MGFDYIDKLNQSFLMLCETVSQIFKESFNKTEGDIGRSLTDDEKKLCLLLGLIHLLDVGKDIQEGNVELLRAHVVHLKKGQAKLFKKARIKDDSSW